MLEAYLEKVEKIKQEAIERVIRATENDSELREVALKEITINDNSLRYHIRELCKDDEEFELNEDLEQLNKDYFCRDYYFSLCNHITHHKLNIKKIIPESVEEGNFKTELQIGKVPKKYEKELYLGD